MPQGNLLKFFEICKKLFPILSDLKSAGANVFLVGGSCRDLVLGQAPVDLDFEVHGLDFEQIERILAVRTKVLRAGKAFLVLKTPRFNADWALPREDKSGRKPEVQHLKETDFKKAAQRRDLTINAIGLSMTDLVSNFDQTLEAAKNSSTPIDQILNFIDPYNGISDLKANILRAVDPEFFVQDPLRLFRVMQFASRFCATVDPSLSQVCKTMTVDLECESSESYCSAERIRTELEKMFEKKGKPSIGISWLVEIGRFNEFFPELTSLVQLVQDCGQRLDWASGLLDRNLYVNVKSKTSLVQARVTLSIFLLARYAKDLESVELFLKRLKFSNKVLDDVKALILSERQIRSFLEMEKTQQSEANFQFRHFARQIWPNFPIIYGALAYALVNGKTLFDCMNIYSQFEEKFKDLGIFGEPIEPLISGRDLIEITKPGPNMGRLIAEAYNFQLRQEITSKELVLNHVKKILQEEG